MAVKLNAHIHGYIPCHSLAKVQWNLSKL